MTTHDEADGGKTSEAGTSRLDLAVARSLDPARARVEKRIQGFLDAALELLSNPDTKDFTVQQVVERSGQSLRSFYQYFDGKYELMLALFEETVAFTARHLSGVVATEDDPLERLRVFLFEHYRMCTPLKDGTAALGGPNPVAIADFAQQLLTDHPKEAAKAFGPLIDQLEQLLRDASDAGEIRDDLDHRRMAGVLLQAIMFSTFASTISGTSLNRSTPDPLWELAYNGLIAR